VWRTYSWKVETVVSEPFKEVGIVVNFLYDVSVQSHCFCCHLLLLRQMLVNLIAIDSYDIRSSWLHSSVVRMWARGCWTFAALCLICGSQITSFGVKLCLLWVSQLYQLSLPSLVGQ